MKLPINQIICGAMPGATKGFPGGSFNCCISSPPYWALRDYGVDGQLGLEKTFEEYIDKLCTIYDEVKRVLRPDGTCWVNLGDTYGGASSRASAGGRAGYGTKREGVYSRGQEKSLCLIPQRFAIEMVNRGWILRNVIIWHKPNPMPSSAKDRFTVDFEYVYFFVKNNQNLWYFRPDGKVSDKQPEYKSGIEGLDWEWGIRKKKKVKLSLWQGFKYWFEPQYEPYSPNSDMEYRKTLRLGKFYRAGNQNPYKDNTPLAGDRKMTPLAEGKNKRTVWTIPTQPFPEAHFATFPEKLVEPMIKAGCPEFVCTKCGKAREKIYDIVRDKTTQSSSTEFKDEGSSRNFGGERWISHPTFKGYTDCGCMNYFCCNCKKYLTLKQFALELKNGSERYKKETRIPEKLGKESLCQDEAIGQSSQRDKLLQSKELYNLWERILRQKDAKDLLSQMRSPMANTKGDTQQVPVGEEERETTKLQRGVDKQLRLQGNISGQKAHVGTSLCNGTKDRPQVKERRASTPHKSHQNGQQDREFRVSNNKKSLSETFPKDTMSTLRGIFQAEPLCPFCNSNQITIKPAEFRPGIMIDIFAGSGTSLQVAARLRRDWVGVELKPEYIKMAEKRARQGETGLSVKEQKQGQQPLFPVETKNE